MKLRPATLLVASGALAVGVLAACSGASTQDLFASNGSRSSPTEPATSSGSSGTSGTSSSPGTSGSSGTSGTSGSSGSSGSSGKDAAPPPWKSPGIFCGVDQDDNALYCTGSTYCCGRLDSNVALSCTASSGPGECAGGAPIRCDDRTDCPGTQVCCGQFDQGTGYRSVKCQATCNDSPTSNQAVRFCDPNAPVDECNETGKVCTLSGSLEGFHVCK